MRRNSHSSRRSIAAVETLESRQLLSVTLGSNLILNPGAESNTGASNTTTVVTPSHWTANGHPTAAKYGTVGAFPTTSSPGPSGRGSEFFAGGPTDMESDLFQTIDVSSIASSIDAKKITYALSGWLGGSTNQGDNVTLFANFQSSSHGLISQVALGPVTAANRGNVTELLSRSKTTTLPVGTRFVQIQLHFERLAGTYDDGYADNLSFVLTQPPTTGQVTGTVFADANTNGKFDLGEKGESGWMVYIDSNNDSQYDPGETEVTTNSSGQYTLTLKPGTYIIRVQVRAGFYETSPHALEFSVTVTAGGKISNDNFGVKAISPV